MMMMMMIICNESIVVTV